MRVLQRHTSAVGPPHMRDHDAALDRVGPDQAGDVRGGARLRIVEAAAAPPLVEGDAPAVAVRPGRAAPAAKPAKLKRMSVGTLAFIPSSSHMPVFAPSPPLHAAAVATRRCLEQHGADEPYDGLLRRKDADDVGAAFDLLVQALQRVRRVQLGPVWCRNAM